MLASTNSHPVEEAAPGSGRGGVGVSGGAPARYAYTAGAFLGLSPWNDDKYTYSIAQLNLGSNPNSKLEIVSAINSFNLGHYMFLYNYTNCPSKYAPKVYFGTTQTIALNWLFDQQTGIKYPSIWPEVKPQKGEL